MNGLPVDTDLSFLLGASLSHVSISQHQVNLGFEPVGDPRTQPGTRIEIHSAIRLVLPLEDEFTTNASTLIGPAMLPLLGTTIAGASVVPPGTLRLTWSNGHVLEIMDSSERYESYVVTCGDKLIVV